MYDYESTNITSKKLKIIGDSFVMLSSDKILSIHKSTEIDITSEIKFISSFSRNGNNYIIDVNKDVFKSKGYQYENSWLVLKGIKGTNGYSLSEGDVIRLGKAQLKINEIKGPKRSKIHKIAINSKNIYSGGLGSSIKTTAENEDPMAVKAIENKETVFPCKICLSDEYSVNDPLITPCYCAGSMGWVHLKCLQKWLSSKIASRDHNNSTSYS